LEGHGRSQQIEGGQEDDLLSQRSQYTARIIDNMAISRAFLQAVLMAIITREGGFTDRHRKYRPPTYSDICRSFSLPPVAAVGAGGTFS
jgi:hypothetical protein